MWNSIYKFGLSQEEINEINEKLWAERQPYAICPDCGVEPNEPHESGCDVARCTECGGQRLGCDCQNEDEEIWTGIWPGIKECYEQRLICCWGDDREWRFDLNEQAMRKQS